MDLKLSKNIRYLRKKEGVSQQELANRLGISRNMLLSYENSSVEPKLTLLLKFSEYFGIRVSALLASTISDENYDQQRKFFTLTVESMDQNIDIEQLDKTTVDEFINSVSRITVIYNGLRALLVYKEEEHSLDGSTKDLMLLIERLLSAHTTFISQLQQ